MSTRRRPPTQQSQTRKVKIKSPLRAAYGEVILKKGTTLYHTSLAPFIPRPDKPMLFLAFHPSEWAVSNSSYVTRVILKKDVSLLFMINIIHRRRVFPLLNTLIGRPGNNIPKRFDSNLACYAEYLKRERFDGWLSSIEGRSSIEVAILNDPALYQTIDCEPVVQDWNYGSVDMKAENVIIPKCWGEKYPVAKYPVEFRIHNRYKPMIESYICDGENDDCYALQLILKNAILRYHTAPDPVPNTIAWPCPAP